MRSPNYPSVILADAIERLRPVYAAVHTYSTPKAVFLENMSYSESSGVGMSLVATLKRYGLVESDGGLLRITQRAVAILELPNGSPERAQALRDAAFGPTLFSEMHAEFPSELPSDGLLRHHLIKKGFLPKAADEIIRVFRANLELVEEKSEAYNPQMESSTQTAPTLRSPTKEEFNRMAASSTAAHLHALGVPIPDGSKTLRLNISRNTEAQIVFYGDVTQEAIDRLAKLLEIQKDTFPTEAELKANENPKGGE